MKQDKLYIIKCHDKRESFIKVGTTEDSLNRRFSGKKMPYKWYELLSINCKCLTALHVEEIISKSFSSYEPMVKFAGYLECFNFSDLEQIVEVAKSSISCMEIEHEMD